MNVDARESELIEVIVGAAYEVGNVLGAGFLERVYERARECALRGLQVNTQVPIPVTYKGQSVGDYYADLVVEGAVIVELKCAEGFSKEHIAQCLNYLKVTGLRVALLVNFERSRVQWRRVVLDIEAQKAYEVVNEHRCT